MQAAMSFFKTEGTWMLFAGQESGRLRKDYGGWMKNREKEMLTDKKNKKNM